MQVASQGEEGLDSRPSLSTDQLARWGLIPEWRLETVPRVFRRCLSLGRCEVLGAGPYVGAARTPWGGE